MGMVSLVQQAVCRRAREPEKLHGDQLDRFARAAPGGTEGLKTEVEDRAAGAEFGIGELMHDRVQMAHNAP
jgi:hypothetical protein